ncbi:ribosomal RNA-processing protein 8 [Gaeumannomyces tritici R3-111a-1]|uniref:Ribosomal RNA-processing protein 8 n=1 Tax=Gaeumannomyces tritici (strain R3-111a-1) TaxID=644352 RepID=J3NNG3_GAET3|nr:ribosomal RNA-processing protein 8 [Gaeumannomyces tritici R3-111a-1]EJT77714.1 ribosomal RNA-processing protein 8 [Gaeumannomyces tritici R3-111a-1]
MFAVPGWSLSADKLKTETAASPSTATTATSASAPSKKRKRPNKGPGGGDVTRDNVADLWARVIEHKEPPSSSSSAASKAQKDASRKRQKANRADRKVAQSAAAAADQAQPAPQPSLGHEPKAAREPAAPAGAAPASLKAEGEPEKPQKKKKDKKKSKRDGKDGGDEAKDSKDAVSSEPEQKPAPAPAPAPTPAPAPAPAPPKLTPLQASMRAKLISARFRHLNETLYTRPSAEAYELFGESPDMFAEYHEGFRQQVNVWPENPVDGYIADIRARAAVRPPPQQSSRGGRGGWGGGSRGGRQQQQRQAASYEASAAGGAEPLPRTAGECTVADLGCGDGRLGGELQGPSAERLRLRVLSFDLQSPAPHVVKADMAALPLADGSVNVAVFCLALMGTNWPAFVEEAYRVLHWKGELWVAEIKSRFAAPARSSGGGKGGGGGGGVVDHSVGNRRKKAAATATAGAKKALAADEARAAASQAEVLAVEVDGAQDRRAAETDVSVFVDVLARRGFVLHGGGDAAVDMSNKMFVKMRFLKAAVPTVGKCVPKEKPQPQPASAGPGGLSKKKFIDTTEPISAADEAKVLKPCMYKLR